MIGIQIDTAFLDLEEGQQVQVVGSNPALDKDSVARVFSYPFRVSATPRNLAALLHANRMDAMRREEDDVAPEVTMYLGGAPFERGRLSIVSVSNENLECSFGNKERNYIDDLEKLKIRSLMPTIDIPQDTRSFWSFAIAPVGSPYEYRLMINGVSYFYLASPGDDEFDAGAALRDQINADYPGTANLVGGDAKLELRAGDNDPWVVSPPYTGLTLEAGYTTVGMAIHANMMAYLADVQATPVESHSFPMIKHRPFYDPTLNLEWTGFVNYFHDGSFGINEKDPVKQWKYTYIPYVKVKYILDRIAEASGFAWSGDFYDSTDFEQLRVFSNYALDKVRYEYFDVQYEYFNSFKIGFDLANHVPDMTAREFVDDFFSLFNLYAVIRGDTITMYKRRDQLTAVANDFGAFMTPQYKMSMVQKRGVTLRFKGTAELTAAWFGQLADYVIGDGKQVLEFDLYPLPDAYTGDVDTDSTFLCAGINEKGSSDELETGINAFPFRVFFDRGLQEDSEGLLYHMGSHLAVNYAGDAIGDLSLEWSGERGLYEVLWKDWAELQEAPPLTMSAVLPIGDVQRLLRWDQPVIRFYHPLGSTRALINTFRFSGRVDDAAYLKVDFELLKL